MPGQIRFELRDGCVRTRAGGWHENRGGYVRANPKSSALPAFGRGYALFRQAIMGRAKRARRQVWLEVNLHHWARYYGRCLSTVRVWWDRLQKDPIFNQNMTVRLHQVRLERNGCPVIVCAHDANLRYDGEPLFYERDRRTSRHVRAGWRADDLETERGEIANFSNSLLKGFSKLQQLSENNGASAENQSSGSAAAPSPCQNPSSDRREPEKTNKPGLLQKPASRTELRMIRNKWEPGKFRTLEGNNKLEKFIRPMIRECCQEIWDNCKVGIGSNHFPIFSDFVRYAVRHGYEGTLIRKIARDAITAAHQAAVDGLAKNPTAYAIDLLWKFLKQADLRPEEQRVAAIYASRRAAPVSQKRSNGRVATVRFLFENPHKIESGQVESGRFHFGCVNAQKSQCNNSKNLRKPFSIGRFLQECSQSQFPRQKDCSDENQTKIEQGARKLSVSSSLSVDKLECPKSPPARARTATPPGASGSTSVQARPLQTVSAPRTARDPAEQEASIRAARHLREFLSSLG